MLGWSNSIVRNLPPSVFAPLVIQDQNLGVKGKSLQEQPVKSDLTYPARPDCAATQRNHPRRPPP